MHLYLKCMHLYTRRQDTKVAVTITIRLRFDGHSIVVRRRFAVEPKSNRSRNHCLTERDVSWTRVGVSLRCRFALRRARISNDWKPRTGHVNSIGNLTTRSDRGSDLPGVGVRHSGCTDDDDDEEDEEGMDDVWA